MGKLTSETPLAIVFSASLHRQRFVGFFLIGLAILSCSGLPSRDARPRGVYHRVKSGETLSVIARAYHVDFQELAEINNVSNPERIEADSVIFIPDVNQVLDDVMTAARPQKPTAALSLEEKSAKEKTVVLKPDIPKKEAAAEGEKRRQQPPADVVTKERTVLSRAVEREMAFRKSSGKPESGETADQSVKPKESDQKAEQIQFDKKRFTWPAHGKVVSQFGIQTNRMYFNGIRIAAGEGTPVQAAADGVVIFSAPLKDYGETIIIQHEDSFATVYSHLGVRTVQGDVKVKKGGRIAFIGKADDRGESYLHFEIRHKNKARNPLFFLP
jgi:murein DD-endopeptidase MepM/ murein hydrolase activator NlpD